MTQPTQISTSSRLFSSLTGDARSVIGLAMANGSISTREACLDLGIDQGSFTKIVSRLSGRGFRVHRERRTNPRSGRQYTRYFFYDPVPESEEA